MTKVPSDWYKIWIATTEYSDKEIIAAYNDNILKNFSSSRIYDANYLALLHAMNALSCFLNFQGMKKNINIFQLGNL